MNHIKAQEQDRFALAGDRIQGDILSVAEESRYHRVQLEINVSMYVCMYITMALFAEKGRSQRKMQDLKM